MSRSRVVIGLAAVSVLLIGTVRLSVARFPLSDDGVYSREKVRSHPPGHPMNAAGGKIAVTANVLPNLRAAGMEPVQSPILEPRRDPIRVGGNVAESKLIYRVEPVYPQEAKRARIRGNVVMVATTDTEGLVSDVKVRSGHPLLAPAAVEAVKQWRYSPTLLNGIPVPVMFTVTCVFNYIGEGDVVVSVDVSGNLKVVQPPMEIENIFPKMAKGGTAYINIAPDVPIRVAEQAIQSLRQRGVARLEVNGPFALREGRLFYSGTPARPPQLEYDTEKLQALLDASVAKDNSGFNRTVQYAIYISEFGEIVGVRRISGPETPEIERELTRTRVITPALLGGNAVPFIYYFRIGM